MLLPDENNFFAKFSRVNKEKIKTSFENNGWTARKVSWTDFEVTNAWSKLSLEGDDVNPLITGKVGYDAKNIKILDRLFNMLACDFKYEFYDDAENLLAERMNVVSPEQI